MLSGDFAVFQYFQNFYKFKGFVRKQYYNNNLLYLRFLVLKTSCLFYKYF